MLSINGSQRLIDRSISSILELCTSPIVVAYAGASEVGKFPKNERISFYGIKGEGTGYDSKDSSTYSLFQDDDFFRLVECKWELFEFAFETLDSDFFIYVDLDVVWLKDVATTLRDVFQSDPSVDALIQDATSDPSNATLCMGLFAFRNSIKSRDLVQAAKLEHQYQNLKRGRYGDDDAITHIFRSRRSDFMILPLPQQTFPIGSMASLWSPFSLIRGLRPDLPYIFHANYVTTLSRKHALLDFFTRLSKKGRVSLFNWLVIWLTQAFKISKK